MHRTIRLMIADDHPALRVGLATVLEKRFKLEIVALAANGVEAVQMFHLHRPDITLMDLRMPVMDGLTATAILLRDVPEARIIIFTSYDGDEDIYRALQAGAKSYVLKDIAVENLVDIIHAVHGGSRQLSPKIAVKLAERVYQPELTERELEVLRQMSEGKTNEEIASVLNISSGTVKTHINHILGKLQVPDRTKAVVIALKRGLIHL
jgi:two-component system, NarL family, response regulator